MSINLNNPNLFVKGTYEVRFFNPKTNDLEYYSNKMQTSNITSSINLGAINAGIGNPTVIQIPDTPKLDVNMTAADFSLEGRALQVGSQVTYNAPEPVDEVVEAAAGGKLAVSQTPCAPLGGCEVVCYINKGGKAYAIDPATKEVQGYTAAAGEKCCVHYYVMNPSAKELAVNTMFAPGVVRAMMKLPVYTKNGTDAMNGSLYGYLYITIPRMQFNGDVSTSGDQTNPATTVMNGTALSYDEACEQGLECGGTSVQPKLAYMVMVPEGDVTQAVEGLCVIGGEVTVGVGKTVQCPVKYVMENDQLVQPDFSALTYEMAENTTATVTADGIIEGKVAGDTILTITLGDVKTTCAVSVTA